MKEILYHYLMGWPIGVNVASLTVGTLKPDYAPHAIQEALCDRYGSVPCPAEIDLTKCMVIELAVDPSWPRCPRKVTKVVYRTGLDARRDMVFVVRWKGSRPTIVTVWSNLKTDKHATLRRDKYRAGKVASGQA